MGGFSYYEIIFSCTQKHIMEKINLTYGSIEEFEFGYGEPLYIRMLPENKITIWAVKVSESDIYEGNFIDYAALIFDLVDCEIIYTMYQWKNLGAEIEAADKSNYDWYNNPQLFEIKGTFHVWEKN
jgi:hypothetical protein